MYLFLLFFSSVISTGRFLAFYFVLFGFGLSYFSHVLGPVQVYGAAWERRREWIELEIRASVWSTVKQQ